MKLTPSTPRHWLINQPAPFHHPDSENAGAHFAMEMKGDSMEPTLRPGNGVIVDTAKTVPTPPGLFVVSCFGGMEIRRVEHIHGSCPRMLRLSYDNQAYRHAEELRHDEVNVIGRVVWIARRL